MSLLNLGLLLFSQVALAAGQVFLKKGMNELDATPRRKGRMIAGLGLGIGMLTIWFFVWMGLLQKLGISYVFPFQGVGHLLLVFAAVFMLRERVGWQTWLGVVLVSTGTALVAMTP